MGTNIFLKTFPVECCATFSAWRKTCPDKIFEELVPIISSPILWKGIRFQNYFAATVQYLNKCYRAPLLRLYWRNRTALHCGVKTTTTSRAKTRGCQSAMFLLCVCILFLFFFVLFCFSFSSSPPEVLRAPMLKCDFNKVAKQLYRNHTSARMFSYKFAAYFQDIFS